MFQDDATLVQRVLAGDQAAFSPLIDRHWSAAMRLALRRLGNVADAEDTVQDAFLQAMVSLSSLQKSDRFSSWLLGIVNNLCRMYWRAHRNGHSLDDEERWVINPFLVDGEVAPSPEALYEACESYQAVLVALTTLPSEQQQAVRLHYFTGLSLGEISVSTGTSTAAIKVRLHRARARLRLALLGEHAELQSYLAGTKQESQMIDASTSHETTTMSDKSVQLPLLPVRDIIVFPGTVVPLYLGRHSSIRAVDHAVLGDNKLFLATQRDAKVNDPAPQDIYAMGVVVTIERRLYLPDGTAKLAVKAEQRGRIVRHLPHSDFLHVEVEPIHEQVDGTQSDIELLVQDVQARFEAHAYKSGTIPPETAGAISPLNEPSLLADTIIGHLPISLENKQFLLEMCDPIQRLRTILTYLPPKLDFRQQIAATPVELEALLLPLEARKLAGDYLFAWFTHDIKSILAMVTDDCVFDDSPMTMAQPIQGTQALASYLTTLFTAFPDFTVMAKQISVDARHVWVEWVMEGTHEGTFLGIAPTRRRFVIRGASALRLCNGKVKEERRYWDASQLLRQLGQLPLSS